MMWNDYSTFFIRREKRGFYNCENCGNKSDVYSVLYPCMTVAVGIGNKAHYVVLGGKTMLVFGQL